MFRQSLFVVSVFCCLMSSTPNNNDKVKAVKIDLSIGSGKHKSLLTIIASDRHVKVFPNNSNLYFLMETDKSAVRDEDKITIVDFGKKEYISLTAGEIKSMVKLRQMLAPVDATPISCNLKATSCEEVVAGVVSKKYTSTISGQQATLYLSKSAEEVLKKHTSYSQIISTAESLDLEGLGIADLSFTTVKTVLSKAKAEGFLTKLELGGHVEYEVTSLQTGFMPSNAFDLPLNQLTKRGLEALLERF